MIKIHHELEHKHPVVRELLFRVRESPGLSLLAQKTVLKYGRPFIGIERPKGYRQRKMKDCFSNSADIALDKRGFYVEGFALGQTGGAWSVQHGWNTTDGIPYKDAPKHWYFGIPFSEKALVRAMRPYWPILDYAASADEIEELMEYAARHPPKFFAAAQ
jgi:hypothetical protein